MTGSIGQAGTGFHTPFSDYGGSTWTDWLFVSAILIPIAVFAVWAKLRGPIAEWDGDGTPPSSQ
jgi:hypothetical protein